MASIALYKRIKKYLTDKRVLILMHFVVSAAQDFQSFMKPLQDQKKPWFMFSTPNVCDPFIAPKIHKKSLVIRLKGES